jgi:hypothetical protein
MLYRENMFFRLSASAILDQLLDAVRSRHKSIDQIAVKGIGCGTKAPQSDAVFSLALFKLQRELTARPQPSCQFP